MPALEYKDELGRVRVSLWAAKIRAKRSIYLTTTNDPVSIDCFGDKAKRGHQSYGTLDELFPKEIRFNGINLTR
jgi:hypothetical protein